MSAKRKIRTAEEVLKEQEETVARDQKNAIALRESANALVADGGNPWLEMSAELDKVLGLPRMKFLDGKFMIGDSEEIPLGTKIIAHASETEYGWTRWENNAPGDKRWGRMADRFAPPAETDLPNNEPIKQPDGSLKKPWQFSMAVPVTILGKDGQLGETFAFVTPSKGGLNAIRGLTRAYGRRRDQGKNGDPACELVADKYFHRTHNSWVYYPIFRIINWTGPDGKPLSLKDDLADEIPTFGGKAA
jgi:hypothetical protein